MRLKQNESTVVSWHDAATEVVGTRKREIEWDEMGWASAKNAVAVGTKAAGVGQINHDTHTHRFTVMLYFSLLFI